MIPGEAEARKPDKRKPTLKCHTDVVVQLRLGVLILTGETEGHLPHDTVPGRIPDNKARRPEILVHLPERPAHRLPERQELRPCILHSPKANAKHPMTISSPAR